MVALPRDVLIDEVGTAASATSGAAAQAQAAAQRPDGVCCDQMMPTMSGAAFCQRLRAQEPAAPIQVILMSAGAAPPPMGPCPDAAFLRKPFPLDAMLELV